MSISSNIMFVFFATTQLVKSWQQTGTNEQNKSNFQTTKCQRLFITALIKQSICNCLHLKSKRKSKAETIYSLGLSLYDYRRTHCETRLGNFGGQRNDSILLMIYFFLPYSRNSPNNTRGLTPSLHSFLPIKGKGEFALVNWGRINWTRSIQSLSLPHGIVPASNWPAGVPNPQSGRGKGASWGWRGQIGYGGQHMPEMG